MSEQERYDFVFARDGKEGADEFALQAYRAYRNWLYRKKAPIKNPDYRKPVLRSAIELRRILA